MKNGVKNVLVPFISYPITDVISILCIFIAFFVLFFSVHSSTVTLF